MRVSSRWYVGYIAPIAGPDELSMTSGQPGVVVIDATSRTSALKQAKKHLKKGSKITGVRWIDELGVKHETGDFPIF
jgi:hypothetical protein